MTSLSHLIFIIFQYILNKQQKFYIQSILFVLSSLQPQVNWLSTFRLIYEKVSTKIDVIYILRLLAGKFGPICIEFSPATFFGKNLNNASWKNARQKKLKSISCKKKSRRVIVNFSFTLKKKKKIKNAQKVPFQFFQKKFWLDLTLF